jgi:hypothetical protein
LPESSAAASSPSGANLALMPTRKQRRRRSKDFRHDVRVYEVDAEGNEVPIAALRARDESTKATPAKRGQKQARGAKGRPMKVAPPPSWERALKRGGLMGAVMLIAFIFLFKNAPIGLRLAWGTFYALAFIPLTYWIDRTAHRTYLKRVARQSDKN